MKNLIKTNSAPAPVGPYNQAIETDGFLFVSGCLGLDPVSGELGECIKCQSKQALENLVSILKEANLGLDSVVKTTVYLKDINDFNTFNEIYAKYFEGTTYPARTCVEVGNLPKGGLVEIEAIAVK